MALTSDQLKQIEEAAAENAAKIKQGEFKNQEVARRAAESIGISSAQSVDTGKKTASKPVTSKEETETTSIPELSVPEIPNDRLYVTKTKAAEAQKAYDDYVNSAEHKANQFAAAQNAAMERLMQQQAGADPSAPYADVYDEKERELKALVDYWNAQVQAEADRSVMVTDLEELSSWSAEDQQALALYATNRNRDANLPMELMGSPFLKTAEQEAAGLIQKYGKQKVDEMAETYLRSENEKTAQAVTEKAQEGAGGSVGGAVGHSVASVGANVMGGLTGILGYMQELGQRTGRYQTLDPNNAGNLLGTYSGAVREEVAQNIEGEDGSNGGWGKFGSILYQGGMSALDSGARALTGTVGNVILSGTSAFTQTVSEASRQGATPAQAMALGATNAAVEALSEKIPLDNLLDVAKGGKQTGRQILMNALKQAGIEVSTEEISLIGTTLAEAAILREKSGYQQQIQQGVAEGKTFEQAKKEADWNLLIEAANTAAVSAISGGITSGGASLAANLTTPAQTQEAAQQPESASRMAETAQQEQVPAAQEAPIQAKGSTLDAVVDKYKTSGAVSNKMAESILADPAAMAQIQEQTGVQIAGTKSQMRDAVKTAVRDLAGGAVEMTKEGGASLLEDVVDGIGQRETQAQSEQVPQEHSAPAEQQSTPQVDTQEPSAEGGQPVMKGTGAAEQNFSGKAEYQDLLYEGNVQPDRPGDVRPMEIPKEDSYGRHVSEFAANAYGAEVTSDRMAGEIESLIQDGALGFDRRSNKESLDAAYDAIYGKEGKKGRGEAGTLNDIRKNIYDGKIKDGDIEKALLLYAKHAGKEGKRSQEYAAELMVDLSTMANMAGRNLQLFKLLRRMTPQGQLMAVEKNVQRYVNDLNKGRSSRKQADVEIPQDLEKAFLTATTDEERDAASDAIYKNVAAQIKPTLGEMWDAWRNLAMLGNPKTHLRNIGGSLAFRPYVSVKRAIGAGIERLTVDQKNRTKAVLGVSKDSRALLKWAKEDAGSKAVMDSMDFSGTTGNESRNEIEDARQILPGKLDTVRKKNMELMEGADMFFKQREYAYSMASFLKARGYSAEDIRTNNVPDSVLAKGRELAVKEAQKATFNDRNAFSDAMSKFRAKGDSGWSKALNAMAKGIMPFTRTPANIVVRAKEYSPVEIARSLDTLTRKVKNGEATVSDGIDQLASGLTGSGAMMLGSALAAGLIPGFRLVGKIEDEDELREGAQEYSLQVGDTYYGISWLAPANIPLFIGANLYNSLSKKEAEGEIDAWDCISALFETSTDALDPMLELSCLSSLADAVENASYEDSGGGMLLSMMASAATSYFTQGLPTIFGQAEQATETTKSSTYSNADNTVQRAFERTVGNATKRIPGIDLYQTEKLDEFGNVVENEENAFLRTVDAFFNPFTKSEAKNDALTKEISRLHDVQPDNVAPPEITKTISYTDAEGERHTGYRLTEEEYHTLATVQGQTAEKILSEAIESDFYKALTDEQKTKVFEYVYDYAREKGRTEALAGYEGLSGWMADIEGKELSAIMNKVVTAAFSDAFTDLSGNWDDNQDYSDSIKALDQAFDVYKALPQEEKTRLYNNSTGRVRYFMEAKFKNMETPTFADLYKQYQDIENKDSDTSAKAQEWAYVLEKAEDSGTITGSQKNAMKNSMMFRYNIKAETEKFDQMTEAGIRADNALNITKLLDGIIPQAGYTNVRDVQKAEAIAGSGLSDADKIAAMKIYLPDSQDKNLDEMLDLGYSVDDYAAAYKIYANESGTGKKRRTITAFQQEFGVSYAAAAALYKIYG